MQRDRNKKAAFIFQLFETAHVKYRMYSQVCGIWHVSQPQDVFHCVQMCIMCIDVAYSEVREVEIMASIEQTCVMKKVLRT